MNQQVKFKVQSVTDIITNSSSEVFMIATDTTKKLIRELCHQIIGEGLNVDDVFEFKYECTTKALDENGEVDYDEDYNYNVLLTEEEFNQANTVDESSIIFVVEAKDPKYNKFASNLSAIIRSYDYEATWG